MIERHTINTVGFYSSEIISLITFKENACKFKRLLVRKKGRHNLHICVSLKRAQ